MLSPAQQKQYIPMRTRLLRFRDNRGRDVQQSPRLRRPTSRSRRSPSGARTSPSPCGERSQTQCVIQIQDVPNRRPDATTSSGSQRMKREHPNLRLHLHISCESNLWLTLATSLPTNYSLQMSIALAAIVAFPGARSTTRRGCRRGEAHGNTPGSPRQAWCRRDTPPPASCLRESAFSRHTQH
jgi:hypothetical protein